jgi:hypothetical protein
MTSSEFQPKEKVYQKYAWLILLGVGVLMLLSTSFILLNGANPPAQFETDTGVAWVDFKRDYPTVATLVSLLELLLGSGYAAVGLFATVIAFTKFRQGERWAWFLLWIVPGLLSLAAVLFFTHDQAYVGYYYIGLVAIALVGLLLPFRKFFPKTS